MKITVLCIGRIKENYWTLALTEYQKRLSRYADLRILELPDEPTPEGASPAEEEKIREREGEKMLRALEKIRGHGAKVVSLEIQGRKLDSVSLAEALGRDQAAGVSHLILLIGGSLGLSERISRAADLRLSFSDLTFPHQMMRVILLEQIYRCFRILNHEPYHK